LKADSYQLEIIPGLAQVDAGQWNALLSPDSTPFLKYEFLNALEEAGCVGGETGWQVAHLIVKDSSSVIVGAMPMYLKQHSYGEFVFDWAWAEAYQQHGLNYYPKCLSAIPFTPVQGSRLLVKDNHDKNSIQEVLLNGLKEIAIQNELSSIHVLFPMANELKALVEHEFMLRDSVQFHWQNQGYENFEHFLSALNMKRRKNIRRERSEVLSYGITFSHIPGQESSDADWEFFYRCYANTYIEHGSQPYLNPELFKLLVQKMPENLHLIIASKYGSPIASALLIVDKENANAYGRYWGSIEYIPCLHFELSYYQAIEYCIREGIQTLEGGAQGEHKMARGFLPKTIQSAHWLADEQFSNAVKLYLKREQAGMAAYVDELAEHTPLKSTKVLP